MIELKGITKNYPTKNGDFTALKGVSLSLPNKGLIALYGENGCGKTTLLNLISTLDTSYEGEILYNGEDIRNVTDWYRRNVVSVVLQENSFVGYLNINDNIQIFSDDESRADTDNKLKAFDIIEKKCENPSCVSGGQKQRVSLIRGLSKKSAVLLVDEPTSSLNELMEKEVFEKLQAEAKEKLVVLVSHNISLIRRYANMVVFMDKGTIRTTETIESAEIEYTGNVIEVPESISTFAVLDTTRVKGMLDEHKEVKLRYCSTEKHPFEPDYSVKSVEKTDRRQNLTPGLRKTIVFSSLWKARGAVAGIAAIVLAVSILIGLLCSLAYFDKDRFAYVSITENVSGYIVVEKKRNSADGLGEFSLGSYAGMKEKYSSKLFIMDDFYSPLNLGFQGSGIFTPDISGLAYCAGGDVNLKYGTFADSGSVMITDYTADGLVILDEKYGSYDEILSDGIDVGGVHFRVSGIVDTNYEDYREIFESDEFTTTQRYIDYQESNRIYHKIFVPLNMGNGDASPRYIALMQGEALAEIKVLDESDAMYETLSGAADACLLSESLYAAYKGSEVLKYSNSYFTVAGVKEGSEGNVVYVTAEKYSTLAEDLFCEISRVAIELQSAEEIGYFEQYGMKHSTSMSSYIDRFTDIVTVLQQAFVVIIIILFVATLACGFATMNVILTRDRHLFGFMRISGYRKSSIVALEAEKMALTAMFAAVIAIPAFAGAAIGLNAILSNLFGYSISIFEVNMLSFAAIILDIALAYSLSLLRCTKLFKMQLVDLVK